MPLPWVRLDTSFASNPKLLAMLLEKDGHRAAFVYLCSLGYSGAHGTDGFLIRECLPFIHGRSADAERLVRHGFWREQPGGWLVHGWDEFQESNTETQARRARAQAAAMARWEGHEAMTNAERQKLHRARKAAANGDGDDAP
jgi:hypothetical protein